MKVAAIVGWFLMFCGHTSLVQAQEPEERPLSREEAMRLLDRLAAIEEQAEALRAARAAQRSKVARDW